MLRLERRVKRFRFWLLVLFILAISLPLTYPVSENNQAISQEKGIEFSHFIAPDCPQPEEIRASAEQIIPAIEIPAPRVDFDPTMGFVYRDQTDFDYQDMAEPDRPPPEPDPVYVYVLVTVSSTWVRGSSLSIKFSLYNDGPTTAYVRLNFLAYDPYLEWSVTTTTSIRPFSTKVKYLYKTIPSTSVGLKKGIAEVEYTSGSQIYYKDYGYAFVQKFGNPNPLPPADATSAKTGSSTYYWEGLSNDGFGVPDSYALWPYCDNWNTLWRAAQWVDGYAKTTPYGAASVLNAQVYSHTDYIHEGQPYYWEARASAWCDYRIRYTMGDSGVCDEFAISYNSLVRALGIPARLILAYGPSISHAYSEVWAGAWYHADPTWNAFNAPWIYALNFKVIDHVWICAKWDDRNGAGSTFWPNDDADGSSTNDMLSWNLDKTAAWYDGPNDYGPLVESAEWHDPCDDESGWKDSPTNPADWWPNPIWDHAAGTLTSHYLGFIRTSSNSGWGTGPFWYKDLGSQPLEMFRELRIKVSYDNPSAIYKGCLAVALYDSNLELVCYIMLYEWTGSYIDMDFYGRWRTQGGTVKSIAEYNVDWTYYKNDIWIYRDSYDEIWVEFGAFYTGGRLLTASEFQAESSRDFRYVGIQWRRGSGTYLNVNLWDIKVEWDMY
jgi:transglutaminase-like putative cysteine protease